MTVLLLIDMQNDFMPGGALEVAEGDTIVPVANTLQLQFDLVVATQDWHPENHASFAINHKGHKPFDEIDLNGLSQTLWPVHCVQNTDGAAFHSDLETSQIEAIFRKGTATDIDSYSAFFDNAHKKSTGLRGYLKEKGATTIYFMGLAADICVYYSVKDALAEGFKCVVIENGVKILNEEIFAQQKKELESKGVKFVNMENGFDV